MVGDRSGSCALEDLLRRPKDGSPILGILSLTETIVVACWYIWWQHREIVKGETMADPCPTTFAITALTANYIPASSTKAKEQGIIWKKPDRGC
jgi:hypothetical protein